MSIPLLKATIKSNWIILLIFFLIILMYIGSFVSMYDPASTQSMEELMEMVPKELLSAMGFNDVPADLTAFIGNYFYGMLVFILPLIYISIIGNKLMAKIVDNGSMACLLSTPNTRVRISLTQGLYFIISIAVMFIMLTGATVAISQAVHPSLLDIPAFIKLNVCAFLLTCSVSSISWFFSCLFNETKYFLTFGVGIPVLLYMLNMIGGIKEDLNRLSSVSLYHLFNASDILSGRANAWGLCIIFTAITLALYSGGILIFKRKNLPI